MSDPTAEMMGVLLTITQAITEICTLATEFEAKAITAERYAERTVAILHRLDKSVKVFT